MRHMVVDMGLMFRSWSMFQPRVDGSISPIINEHPRNGGVILFFHMVSSAIFKYDPTVIHFCFDSSQSIRKEMYDLYKANRPDKDPDYVRQMKVAKMLLESAGFDVYEADGYEADDLIYTITNEVKNDDGVVVHVITGDKDLLALCDDNVSVSRIRSGEIDTADGPRRATFRDHVTLYTGGFRQEFGVEPDQFSDLKGIAGDKSDNIPGIPGLGPGKGKTLLHFFLNLEELFDSDEESIVMIPGFGEATASKIFDANNQELAYLSRELAKLREVPDIDINPTIFSVDDYRDMVDYLIQKS